MTRGITENARYVIDPLDGRSRTGGCRAQPSDKDVQAIYYSAPYFAR